MGIIAQPRAGNLSRLSELWNFTMQNLMFYLAISALLLFLFDLFGGWAIVGVTRWQSVLAWFFLIAGCLLVLFLIVRGIWWLFSKKEERVSPEFKATQELTKKIENLDSGIADLKQIVDNLPGIINKN